MTLRPDLQLVADLIPSGSRVLDLGCGSGALLSELMRAHACRGTGVEIDPEHLDAACELGHEADDGARQHRLAGAGSADETEDLAAADIEIEAVEHPSRPEVDA